MCRRLWRLCAASTTLIDSSDLLHIFMRHDNLFHVETQYHAPCKTCVQSRCHHRDPWVIVRPSELCGCATVADSGWERPTIFLTRPPIHSSHRLAKKTDTSRLIIIIAVIVYPLHRRRCCFEHHLCPTCLPLALCHAAWFGSSFR